MSSFFNYFPSLLYSNTAVTNIIAKIKFEESVSKNLAVYYPYTITEGERADHIAAHYYEDPSYDWVVYLSNGIIDPVHEWPKSSYDFDRHIIAKYGTIANSQIQTAFYRVNFENDDSVISPAAYDALSIGQKKYWSPIVGYSDNVVNYERKQMDLATETNKVVSLTGTFGSFTNSTVIRQSGGVQGTVLIANTTNVIIENISGTWTAGTPVTYATTGTVANATISTVTTLHQAIPSDEIAYWEPVSFYDYEADDNEKKKYIRILSSTFLNLVERDMKDLLSV